jgi:hypothetical protein
MAPILSQSQDKCRIGCGTQEGPCHPCGNATKVEYRVDQKVDQQVLVDLLQRGCADGADRTAWDAADFLHERGTVQSALTHAALFMPRFEEIEGEIFFADLGVKAPGGRDGLAEKIRQSRAQSPHALTRFVDSCNWLELAYMFRDGSGTDEAYRLLANLIAEAWRMRLCCLFPDRTFRTRVIEPEETGSRIGIGFEKLA